MKKVFHSLLAAFVLTACGSEKQAPIDREALVPVTIPKYPHSIRWLRLVSATVNLRSR